MVFDIWWMVIKPPISAPFGAFRIDGMTRWRFLSNNLTTRKIISIMYQISPWTLYSYIMTIAGWWFRTFFFPIQLGMISPIDFHIFQRGLVNHQQDSYQHYWTVHNIHNTSLVQHRGVTPGGLSGSRRCREGDVTWGHPGTKAVSPYSWLRKRR